MALHKISKVGRRYGCTPEQWDLLNNHPDLPVRTYKHFIYNYQQNHETSDIRITLWEWWTLWQESGFWGHHKRGNGDYYVLSFRDRARALTKDNAIVVKFAGRYTRERATDNLNAG